MLKNSRLHGDVDLELCEIFTTRVSELTTLRRLVGFIQESDEHEVVDLSGKRVKRP
jgi:hypothetical protein